MFKKPSWLGKRKYKVFVDPGHGGLDDGASAGPGKYLSEDEINLTVGLFLDLMLRNLGIETALSRNRDIGLSLQDRCVAANEWGADIFVSIHINAFQRPSATGLGVYVYEKTKNPDTQRLAEIINQGFVDDFPIHTQRGVFGENFYVLKRTRMPAVLVECEFISNPTQAEWLRKIESRYLLAFSLSRSIAQFFGNLSKGGWLAKKERLGASIDS
jgi:N-acetylmuramoyl-L-alanine amidase